MLLTCVAGQLFGDYGRVSRGQEFECADSWAFNLIARGLAVRKMPPEVLVEPGLVTCLCVTRNRAEWLPSALNCFQRQTYSKLELLVIADGERIDDIFPATVLMIRIIHIEEGYTIGQKRNFGCSLARGEFIAHWDDDDHSMPDRIDRQVVLLEASKKSVTGFHSMEFKDTRDAKEFGQRSSRYEWRTTPDFALGTSLCYRKSYWKGNPFPPINDGEDTAFVKTARGKDELLAVESHGLMVGTIHDSNTHPRDMSEHYWRKLA